MEVKNERVIPVTELPLTIGIEFACVEGVCSPEGGIERPAQGRAAEEVNRGRPDKGWCGAPWVEEAGLMPSLT